MSPLPGGYIAPAQLVRKIADNKILVPSNDVIMTGFDPIVLSDIAVTGFINGRTLIAPNIIHITENVTHSWRLWGRLSDSVPLGLFNGYINLTDGGAAGFPWTKTLSDGIIHFEPRLDYDEDDYWYKVTSVDDQAPGVTVAPSLITLGVWTLGQTWTIGHGGNGGGWRTMRLDWSTAGSDASIVGTIFIRFIADL